MCSRGSLSRVASSASLRIRMGRPRISDAGGGRIWSGDGRKTV